MPAEDVLTYKVEVDAADLPQQLEQLRSQMDMALGSMAFGSAPPPPEMTQGPMNFMFNAAPDVGHQQMIDATSQGFLATQQGMAQAEGGGLMSFLNSNVDAFKLGYSKFHTGMERMGLMVPPSPLVQFPMQGQSAYGEQMQHLEQLGLPGGPLFTATGMEQAAAHMPGLITGAMGMGYDPDTMPMSRFEFQDAYGGAAGKRTRDFFEGNAGAIGGAVLGGVIGAAGGPVGVIGGATIGMAGDMVMGWAGAKRREEEQVGKALRRISQRGTAMQKGFTEEEGAELAGELLGQADTYEARINKVSRDTIQSQLLDFTQAGGFESTTTADEFKATAQGVIDNTRKIMQTLRMTQEEATKFMAEMNREGLMNTADSGGFAMSVAANAKVAGLDPTMMLNEMRAGAEMFRGSAYEMGGGMNMLMDAKLTTQQMLQTAPGGVDIVRELGGIQQASMGLAQNNANFMQTGMGMLAYNNAQAGGAGNDTLAMLGNAGGMSPFDWYGQRAQMAKDVGSGEINQQEIAGFRLDPVLDMYSRQFKRTEGRGMGVDDFEGFFHFTTQAGITGSVAEAKQLFATRFADPAEGTQRNIQALNLQLDKMNEPEPVSILQKMSAQLGEIGSGIAAPFQAIESKIHDMWDGGENWIGDAYLDRTRYALDTTSHTSNEKQRAVAKRSKTGHLNKEESTFLAEVREEYLTHIETTGEISDDVYLKTGLADDTVEQRNAKWKTRSNVIKDTISERLGVSYLYGSDAPTSVTDPSTFMKGHTVPTGFSSYAGNASVSELFDKNVTELSGIDISDLESVLGDDFEWGTIGSEFSLSKRGTGYPELTGGANWGDADISGIDSLIVGMMQAEGTLTSSGALGNSSGLTRGNHNKNPINIRAPHTRTKAGADGIMKTDDDILGYTDIVTAFQRENMGMNEKSAGFGNLGPQTLAKMQDMGQHDPSALYSLSTAQYFWDGVEGIDDLGFVKFKDYESGFTAARQQVLVGATEDLSINEYLNKHAPGFENDVGNVINTVTSRLYKHAGPAGIPDSTNQYINDQGLNTTNILTSSEKPDGRGDPYAIRAEDNIYDLASAIDPANADIGAVQNFQSAYSKLKRGGFEDALTLNEGNSTYGRLDTATTDAYRQVMGMGVGAFAQPEPGPNVYDLAMGIEGELETETLTAKTVQTFQAAYMNMKEGDQGWGTFGPATNKKFQEAKQLGRDHFAQPADASGPNAYDLASAIDPAAADIDAVKAFQSAYMGINEGDTGYGKFGTATTDAYREVMALGAEAFTLEDDGFDTVADQKLNIANGVDDTLQILSIDLSMNSSIQDTNNSSRWLDTDSGKYKFLNKDELTELTQQGGNNPIINKDYALTLASMFHGEDTVAKTDLLTEFVLKMGTTGDTGQGNLSGALLELGLVNISSDGAVQAEEKLFLEEKAMDMYSTFVLPKKSQLTTKSRALRETADYKQVMAGGHEDLNGVIVKNSDRLADLQSGFEGAQIAALDVATDILHNEGLLTNFVDANDDGTVTFSEVGGEEFSQIRELLHTSNPEVYDELFLSGEGSLAEALQGVPDGKTNYKAMMKGDFYAKGTLSVNQQALRWKEEQLDKRVTAVQEKYEVSDADKEALLQTSAWYGETGNVNVENNPFYWKQVAGGATFAAGAVLFAAGAITSWTGVGAVAGMGGGSALMATGATIAGGDAVIDMAADSGTTHLGKLLNVSLAEDMLDGELDIFGSEYAGEGRIDFRTLDGAEQLQIFTDLVLDNDTKADNIFLDQLKDISTQTVEGQAVFDVKIQGLMNNAINAGESLRTQNREGVAGIQSDLDQLDLARGISAGLGSKRNYVQYGGEKGGTDLSTFERVQGLKKQLTEEKEQLHIDSTQGDYLANIIREATQGVSTQNYASGEGKGEDGEALVMNYADWAEAGNVSEGITDGKWDRETKNEDYEKYVHKTRRQTGAGKLGEVFAKAQLENSDLAAQAANVQEDQLALNKLRDKDNSDEGVYAKNIISRTDIIINKLEQILRKA